MRISTIISFSLMLFLWFGYANKVNAAEAENNDAVIKKNMNEDTDLRFLSSFAEESAVTSVNKGANTATNKDTNKAIKSTPEAEHNYKISFDNIFQYSDKKKSSDLFFNMANKTKSGWSNLMRLGVRGDTSLRPNLSLKTDLLFNVYSRKNDHFKASDDLRLDIKEAYLSWQQSDTSFIDIGRINIKSGVATGFNPTDYFKVGAVLDRNTEDISQLRDARLGALVLRGQKLWNNGSLTLVVSPKMSHKQNHWTTDKDIFGLNLHKSNDRSRVMLKLNQKISDDLNPELIYYTESEKHKLGLNISKSFNDHWIGYMEWNIGKRRRLIDEALYKYRKSGQLHPLVASTFTKDKGEKYQQQFAVGASFTSNSNITTSLEYHYNQAGLSKTNSKQFFNAAELASTNKHYAATGQLLSIRGLAQSRGEPLGQHSLFLRSKMNDIGINNLDLTGLLIADLNDQSYLAQAEVAYELNPKSSLAFRLAKFKGNKKSQYGSLDNDITATLQFEYDF